MPEFTNIAAYKFARLEDLKPLRESLIARCKAWGLKGTILLSPEGINLFMAGGAAEVEELLTLLRTLPGLETLTPKYSLSDHQPFTRLLVRLKKEIIAFGVEGISPADHTSPKLAPQTLKQWLDEGRPITLLDTRNDYEVKLGTFKGALIPGIDHFRDFPEAVRRLPEELKHQPVVMFCTGGIRCEKAGPFMEREGFEQIYQLDGGILKYFEDCGSDHYEGECFVFDQRVGVDPSLRETDSALCYACQTPLSPEDQQDPRFHASTSCPYCYKTTAEQQAETLVQRHAALRKAVDPLPGSVAYDNERPIHVPREYDESTLLEMVCGLFPHIPAEEWALRCADGRFHRESAVGPVMAATDLVRAGERCVQRFPAATEPEVNPDVRLIHEDEAILVLLKPAPLPMHPGGRFNRNTLQYFLNAVYAPQRPRFVHRLDANTTGLVVCARTRHFAALLQQQFRKGQVEKIYLARTQGQPAWDEYTSEVPISADPGHLGTHAVDEEAGQACRTEFRVLRRDGDGTALLEARPLTGRTNQIRVHLWHLGFPLQGDAAYLPGQQLGDTQTLDLADRPLCLHAWKLAFHHPLTGERLEFVSERPGWAQ
jgi:RluA family pseudouridine synthase